MLQYIELGSSAILEPERYGLAALERLRYGRGLFDESKFTRDEDGQFASKGGGGSRAAIADEPFGLTSGPKPKARTGKGASSDAQGSLFDKDLHGQESRDLPGQKNFLGAESDKMSGIDKSDSPSRSPKEGTAIGGEPESHSKIDVSDARYAKGQKAVRPGSDDSGFKTRAGRVAAAMGGRWSNRERAYIMSPTKAAKCEQLVKDGYDASSIGGELIPPSLPPRS